MRVHQLTLTVLAAAASLSLTACGGNGSTAQSGASSASTGPSASTPSSPADGSSSGGSNQGSGKTSGAKDSAGKSSGGTGTSAGTGSSGGGKGGKCRTDDLKITAMDNTISGDPDGTVAVTLQNTGGRDCTISGYAGVDLKTSAGPLSAKRTGQQPSSSVLRNGQSIAFSINYPINTSGGSGVRITGLVVTPPDETKSVTLRWPGAATLPVTDGTGSPVKVGPIGSAGQGG